MSFVSLSRVRLESFAAIYSFSKPRILAHLLQTLMNAACKFSTSLNLFTKKSHRRPKLAFLISFDSALNVSSEPSNSKG
jgi:hypothetical protein